MLSPRELRSLENACSFETKSLFDHLIEYQRLIDTLLYLNETLKEKSVSIKPWQKYSETLLFKICFHGFSIFDILRGHKLSSEYYPEYLNGHVITDRASAKVILRSQLETFLMYNHIYVNPDTDDEKELRYNAWIYASLYQRQSFPSRTKFAKDQKARDMAEMEKIKNHIQTLSAFKKLNTKQQNALLSAGSHKLFSHWSQILKETGYDENHLFSVMYMHWSMYAHSEGVSIIQLHQRSMKTDTQDKNVISDIQASKIMICLMIHNLRDLFPIVELKYETLSEVMRFDIEFYINISKISKF